MRIAMWSGPRNLSTAMMYAFAQRSDCAVWDEPFYAAYLQATGLDHPMRDAILAAGMRDPEAVIRACTGPVPNGKTVFYQKHMTQHMIPGFDRGWIDGLTNVFLIRDPARVIASYAAKRENPTLDDIGFRQQAELFDAVCQRNGTAPPVLDSVDIRADPGAALALLCDAIGLDFQEAMLTWPAGGNAADGVWAAHWYGAVWRSTGFADPEGPLPTVADALRDVHDAAQPHYQRMLAHALRPA
ncbi:MAG: HAD family hydrolase [Rhodobacteraceae bacterium]|nr:HAD family hydrolase [Paracoccaceae bacterium]